jgi:hypothetical protein
MTSAPGQEPASLQGSIDAKSGGTMNATTPGRTKNANKARRNITAPNGQNDQREHNERLVNSMVIRRIKFFQKGFRYSKVTGGRPVKIISFSVTKLARN